MPVNSFEGDEEISRGVDRVLITGAVREIPLIVAGVVEEEDLYWGHLVDPFNKPY